MNFTCGRSGALLWEAFAECGIHWGFVPSLGAALAVCTLLLASVQPENQMSPIMDSVGPREVVVGSHCGQGQLSGVQWRVRLFPSLCFSVREVEFNLLANLWWWNSFLLCLFRLLWHPPMQASTTPLGCQVLWVEQRKEGCWLLIAALPHTWPCCNVTRLGSA